MARRKPKVSDPRFTDEQLADAIAARRQVPPSEPKPKPRARTRGDEVRRRAIAAEKARQTREANKKKGAGS